LKSLAPKAVDRGYRRNGPSAALWKGRTEVFCFLTPLEPFKWHVFVHSAVTPALGFGDKRIAGFCKPTEKTTLRAAYNVTDRATPAAAVSAINVCRRLRGS